MGAIDPIAPGGRILRHPPVLVPGAHFAPPVPQPRTVLPSSASEDMLVILHSGSSSYVEELHRALGTAPLCRCSRLTWLRPIS